MSAKVEKQNAGKSGSRVRQLEAELQNVRAELRETIERYEALTEDARAVREKFVEEELPESEERLKLTAEAGRIGNWQIDLTTDTLESSAICKANFGLAANEDLSFERFFEILHADDRDRVRAALAKAVETGTDYDAEYRVVWSDDSVHWIVARGRAFYAADGTPLRMLGVTQNITGRKKTEQRLRKSEERFRSYFELGLIGMAITSPTKGFLEVNDEICKILGYERGELLQMNWAEMTHPDDVAADVAEFNRVMAGEIDGYKLDKRWICRDGQIVDTIISVKALRRADGSVDHFVALLEDITERKRAEEALRESEENYRVIVNQSVAGISKLDLDGGIIFSNGRFCEMLGYDCAELLKLKIEDIVYAEDAARNDWLFKRLKNQGLSFEIEKRLVRKDGSLIWVNNQVSPIFGGDGKPDSAIVVSVDITERKQAQNERQKFVSLVENSQEFIGICDMDLLPVYINEAAAKMVGLENREGVRQTPVSDFFFAEDRDFIIREFFPRVLRDGAGELEMRLRHFQTNEPLWMIFTAFLVTDADGQTIGFGTVSRNISERKLAEERLRTSEEWLRQATEAGRVFVWEVDLLKQTAKFSDNVERVLGFPLPTNLEGNFAAIHPDDRERQREIVENAIASGERFDEEHRISNPSGGASVWVRASGAVVVGNDGKPAHLVGMTQNITERKQAEKALREAHDELEKRVERRTAELSRTNTLLREANENVEMILGSITDKFFALDSEWRITAFNKHAEEQLEALGKNPAGIIGKSLWDEFPDPPVEEAFRRAMNERAAIVHEHYYPQLEEWIENRIYPSKDGGLAIFQRYVTARKQAEEERARLLRQLVFAQEDERRRIAQDLHDEMGQYLSALTLGLDSLKTFLSNAAQSRSDAIVPSSAITQIERLEKIAREVDREVDRLTFELRPPSLDRLGLLAALRQYVENWSQITGIEIDFSSTGMENIRLSAEIETTLYRVVQEALTNAAKHARASRASVTLQHTHNRHVRLVIEDDGRGFDIDKVKDAPDAQRKLGLAGMRERLAQVGGAFEIESAKGKGTAVFVRVPLQAKDEG